MISYDCGIPCHIKRERKTSIISPIHDMDSETLKSNYHPISVLSVGWKSGVEAE